MRSGSLFGPVLMLAALAVIFVSFQFNYFGAAPQVFFENHQRDSESLVIGRMVASQQDGFLSHDWFLGQFDDGIELPDENPAAKVDYQYSLYLSGKKPEFDFQVYRSSDGIQGLLYSIADRALASVGVASGQTRLTLLKSITSLLLAGMLVTFVSIARRHFGYLAALTAVVLIAASQWLVVFSVNLYWAFFLVLAPFVVVSVFLQRESDAGKRFERCYLFAYLAILVKSLAGYEFLSTILIAMVTPLVFYALKDAWAVRLFLRRCLYLGLSGISGFLTAAVIHAMQLGREYDGIFAGFRAILYVAAKRTHGSDSLGEEQIREALDSSIGQVFSFYWNGVAFDLDALFGAGGLVRFSEIIGVLMAVSLLLLVMVCVSKRLAGYTRPAVALVATLWFSFLAPLSWHVLAKAHSYIHSHINHVLWYVPFLLIGFVCLGFFIHVAIRLFLAASPARKVLSAAILIAVASLTPFVNDQLQAVRDKENARVLDERNKDLVRSMKHLQDMDGGRVGLYYANRKLVFVSADCERAGAYPFFLHLVPFETSLLGPARQPHGFDNLDFVWSAAGSFVFEGDIAGTAGGSKAAPKAGEDGNAAQVDKSNSAALAARRCVAQIQMRRYPVRELYTGQLDGDKRLWQDAISFAGSRFTTTLDLPALPAGSLKGGINSKWPGFILDNTFEARQSIRPGDRVSFAHSGTRVVERMRYTDQYINIDVSGPALDTKLDGFPAKVTLLPREK